VVVVQKLVVQLRAGLRTLASEKKGTTSFARDRSNASNTTKSELKIERAVGYF